MKRDWEQFLQMTKRMYIESPQLPRSCPGCGMRLTWGWVEDELWEPCEPGVIPCHRIPRPDQTLFCPHCEERILN